MIDLALGRGMRASAAISPLSRLRSARRNPPRRSVGDLGAGIADAEGERPAGRRVSGGAPGGFGEQACGLGGPGLGPGSIAARRIERRLRPRDRRAVRFHPRSGGRRRPRPWRLDRLWGGRGCRGGLDHHVRRPGTGLPRLNQGQQDHDPEQDTPQVGQEVQVRFRLGTPRLRDRRPITHQNRPLGKKSRTLVSAT